MSTVRNSYKNTQRWRFKARRWATEYAGGKCQSCSYDAYQGNLIFHHLFDKEYEVSRLINGCASWEVILKEINKCVMICANCHGEIHAGLRECPTIDLELRQETLKKLLAERPIPKREQIHSCVSCGKPISKLKKYCDQKCAHKAVERIVWPENLKELVEASSARAVAKTLGVSDHAVAKRIKRAE